MATVIGAIDLNETRVPIVIPLAVISIFGVAQLFLGSDPLIVLMCVAGITVTFLPLHLYGRDLYSIFSLLFGVRYLAFALIAKTFYGQALDTNLYNPFAAYALALLLMIVETTVIILARNWDPGTAAVSFPTDLPGLRRLAIICFSIGVGGLVVVAASRSGDDADAGTHAGVLFGIASELANLSILGVIAEAAYGIEKSKGRSLFTPMLIFMLVFMLFGVIAMNIRGFLLGCIVSLGIVAFIYKMLKWRYIVIGAAFAAFFMLFLSPVTLYLRAQRGMPKLQFIELAQNTVIRAALDSNFRKVIYDTAKYAALQNLNATDSYDYYGDRSNVMNRLAFVGLLDAVYNGSRGRNPIGMPAVQLSLAVSTPSFLSSSKPSFPYTDWLAWQMGLSNPGSIAYLNFGLPMEGLATWGIIGLILYPFIFTLPVLLIFARISSFRLAVPLSIFLFSDLQAGIIEGNSDHFLGNIIKGAPLSFIIFFGLYIIFFRFFGQPVRGALSPAK